MRVLIVGAGLGGLCLAHGLRRGGIDVTVFERDTRSGVQPASYGIHLNADGLAALRSCLPDENWRQLIESSAKALDIVRFRDEHLGVLAQRDHECAPVNADAVTRRRAVRRDALRDVLLLDLDGVVDWGKQFERYTPLAGGEVSVRCADGTDHVADLVVGAEGSSSRVRAQRLPTLRRRELGVLNIAGRVPISADLRTRVPATLIDGSINNIVPARPGWMFVSTWNAPAGQDVGEFAVWAWAASRDSYPDDVEAWGSVALHHFVTARVASWSPGLRSMIQATDPVDVSCVPLRTMPHLPDWSPTAVTLLGDAIHNMTPMAGIGANTALRDAAELTQALTRQISPDPSLLECVGGYETLMRSYANEALALSTRNARNAATPARFPRVAFRAALRIAGALPPVNRRMFGRPPATTGA